MFLDNTQKTKVDLWKLAKRIIFGISQPMIEVIYGMRKDTINYFPLISWGLFFDYLILSHTDKKIFKYLKLEFLYPTHFITYAMYACFGVTLGFWIWGAIQTRRRTNMIQRLSEVFQESNLKSPMGKLPNFIFDKPVDELVRRLRITNAYMPKAKFVEAKDKLESALQVYIDEISDDKSNGTIDVLYSHYEIARLVSIDGVSRVGKDNFIVGQTRARTMAGNLKETPHLLIGGQTGGGKSTFLRQLITTLYCNNANYQFSLIDMKGGLEFQLFENRDRVSVISEIIDAKARFEKLDGLLQSRLAILKANECKDIEEFSQKDQSKIVKPKGVTDEKLKLDRHIVVIDEAAELFLSSFKNANDVQGINRIATRLAAQGRAVGIHLIIATQKPDTKAVNGQIKANLTGIVSFPMATLGASLSILGTGRAKELPATPGRAIWKSGLEQYEVQTVFLSPEEASLELDKICKKKDKESES